jgi:hypothetical protein
MMMMMAIRTSGTSGVTRATRYYIPEDGILHSRHREKPQILRNNIGDRISARYE